MQNKKEKGSKKLIQDYVNDSERVKILNQKIIDGLKLKNHRIDWVSPLQEEGYKEYKDKDFLDKLGLKAHIKKLENFWPEPGPRWDALGKILDSKGKEIYILLEAKANIPEICSQCEATSEESIKKINQALKGTCEWLKCKVDIDIWLDYFYQYANRLAHLYFFREKIKKNAYMVFLYFINDSTHITTSEEKWEGALQLQKKLMKLNSSKLKKENVIEIFIDVALKTKLSKTTVRNK